MAQSNHTISDSESSDHDNELHKKSSNLGNILKTASSENLASDLSGPQDLNAHQLFANSSEKGGAIKKVKLSLRRPKIDKARKNKKDNTLNLELKEWKEKLKCIKPSECLKNIIVVIEESLLTFSIFEEVIKTLNTNGLRYEVVKTNHASVTWRWQEISAEFCKTFHLIVVWNYEKFISIVRKGLVIDYFIQLKKKKRNYRIYLILYGEKGFFREKHIKNEMDFSLCELELRAGISHWKFDKSHELANFMLHMSKSVAQEPYRFEKEKLEQDKTFYLQGRSNNCVKVDRQNNGMKRLWTQQIAAFHRLPLDSAKVVCGNYPTPYCLYEAYNKMPTVKEKKDLLQDILVGRGGVAKRLGPRMSGRIALLFGNSNGNLRLSDWK